MRWLILSCALLAGCGGVRPNAVPTAAPDLSKVFSVIGRFGVIGSACPIDQERILTAAHLADLRPFDPAIGLFPYPFSSEAGDEGIMVPVSVDNLHDLAEYLPVEPLSLYYQVAQEAPQPGDTLWWSEYCFDNKDCAFERERKSSKVTRIVSGHIILREELEGGSSGSCVVNSKGEVVGVVSFGKRVGNFTEEVGAAVAVYGPWLDAQARADERRREWQRKRVPEFVVIEAKP